MKIMLRMAWSSVLCLAFHHRLSSAFLATSTYSPKRILSVAMMSTSASSEGNTSQINVAANLESVQQRIQEACTEAGRDPSSVTLVAVSKTKPLELLQQVHQDGQHNIFGENYVQELMEKAPLMPPNEIHWHYIGPLQSNKATPLIKSVLPHAASLTIETVATIKLARKLNQAMQDFAPADKIPLSIFVQVNTSGEESKSGVSPGDDVVSLCQEISDSCPQLHLEGLMTIGAVGDESCFDILSKCKEQVDEASSSRSEPMKLSMGMSGDFEQAISKGATHVRVGSTIFGARDYFNK